MADAMPHKIPTTSTDHIIITTPACTYRFFTLLFNNSNPSEYATHPMHQAIPMKVNAIAVPISTHKIAKPSFFRIILLNRMSFIGEYEI